MGFYSDIKRYFLTAVIAVPLAFGAVSSEAHAEEVYKPTYSKYKAAADSLMWKNEQILRDLGQEATKHILLPDPTGMSVIPFVKEYTESCSKILDNAFDTLDQHYGDPSGTRTPSNIPKLQGTNFSRELSKPTYQEQHKIDHQIMELRQLQSWRQYNNFRDAMDRSFREQCRIPTSTTDYLKFLDTKLMTDVYKPHVEVPNLRGSFRTHVPPSSRIFQSPTFNLDTYKPLRMPQTRIDTQSPAFYQPQIKIPNLREQFRMYDTFHQKSLYKSPQIYTPLPSVRHSPIMIHDSFHTPLHSGYRPTGIVR